MKTLLRFVFSSLCLIIFLVISPTAFAEKVDISEDNFPDPVFRNYVLINCDTDGDSKLSETEISRSRRVSLNNNGVSSLKGIEFLTALTSLSCGSNQLTRLDVSNNIALTSLSCPNNQLTRLDVSNNTALTSLTCVSNQLTRLDVSNNVALTSLSCDMNQLTSLDVSNNKTLTRLNCGNNKLTSLDVSNNTTLSHLQCSFNQLTSLNVSNNTALTSLECGSNQLTYLTVSNNTALTSLDCYHNQLTELDVSRNTVLTSLDCYHNQLTELDVSNNTALTSLNCAYNQLTLLDVSLCNHLRYLVCHSNHLINLDISNCPKLVVLVSNSQPYTDECGIRYGGSAGVWSSSDTVLFYGKDTTLITTTPDLVLPASLEVISEEAFAGGAFRYVKLSEQTEQIGPFAFADCPNLKYIWIPNDTVTIDDKAFGDIQELVIFGKAGSTADDYAYEHYFDFIPIS